MNDNAPDSGKTSSVVAIFALLTLGGLLTVPLTFIMYGTAGALGGALLLALLISFQAAVYMMARFVRKRLT